MKKIFKIFLVFLLLIKSDFIFAENNSKTTLKTPIRIIATVSNAPFSFVLPDGTKTGLYVDFWRLWSEINDIPIEIVMTELEEGILQVKNKRAIHSGLFYNNKRAKWADFSLPIHQVETGILYCRGFDKSAKLSQQHDITVSAYSGSFQATYVKDNHPQVEFLPYVKDEIAFKQLLDKKIQAIVAETPYLKSQVASLGMNGVFTLADEVLLTNQVHAVIAKGQPELVEVINSGIENIPIQLIIDLEKKWLPTLEPFFKEFGPLAELTISEKKWLLDHPNLKLGIDSVWYPFDFTDSDGNFTGIAADYIKHVSDTLNINFEPEKGATWKESLDAIISEDVDVMAAVAITGERKNFLNFTEAYFTAPIVIVTNKNSFFANNMKSLSGKTLGIVKGYAMNDWVGRDFPDIKIQPVDSIVDGLERVNSGEIDAYTGAIAVINYEIEKRDLHNIQISAFAPYDFEIAMVVRNGLEPLIPILNKIFSNMSESQKAAIANNWLAVRVENGTKLSTVLLIGLPIFLILMMIILTILKLNKRLKREIENRIKIEEELKHLAQHDELTGLANWRLFEELSNVELNKRQSINGEHAFLFVDIDGFKNVNDTYGHRTGDLLLVAIAKRLNSCLENTNMIARIGGDEFIIYLPDNVNTEDTHSIASNILKSLSLPYDLEGRQVEVTASIGISLAPDDGKDVETLIKNADAAMYEAKKSGKNTYRHFKNIE